jgi:hypothetical protein
LRTDDETFAFFGAFVTDREALLVFGLAALLFVVAIKYLAI